MIQIKKRFQLFCVSATVIFNSGCSILSPEPTEISEAEACEQVKEIIAAYDKGFEKFKASQVIVNNLGNVQIWRTNKVFPGAKICQVWGWSSGLNSYNCSWQADDEVSAKSTHDYSVQLLQGCLSKQWTSQTSQTKSGGLSTSFSLPASSNVVSINAFKESLTILENWKVNLYIGDKSNLNVDVQ